MEAALRAAIRQVVPAVSAPPASPPLDHPGRETRAFGPPPSPSTIILPLPAFVTLASPHFTLSCLPWNVWVPAWAGFISARGLVEQGGTTGLAGGGGGLQGAVVNSLWNGSKSGWGGSMWAEEIVAVVGAQLGQVGPGFASEGEAPSLAKIASWGPYCQFR